MTTTTRRSFLRNTAFAFTAAATLPRFTRADGAPFVLPSGQVWVQIVPLEAEVTVS